MDISGERSNIPKMRGLAEAIDELHKADPGSGFTLHALRKAVNGGEIPCVRCGRKILVNMDKVFEYLYSGSPVEDVVPQKRRIQIISGKR